MLFLRNTIILVTLLGGYSGSGAFAQEEFSNEVEGYLEPFKNIEVSTVETGIIDSIQIKEGDYVSRGQVLVRLDRNVLEKSFEVAKQESESVGNLRTAQAEWELQKKRLQMLQNIFDRGHGRKSELERARADVEVAKGRVLQAEELVAIKNKELNHIRSRVEARDIKAPIDGIVVEIHKNAGEAVSPTNPVLVTVVNIEQLKCVLNVPRDQARKIQANQSIELESDERQKIIGAVQWKSPIVDAESETVKVIVRIDNPNGVYTSGEHCVLNDNSRFADNAAVKNKSQSVSHQDLLGISNVNE